MIQTSYFGRLRLLREHHRLRDCVPITRHLPSWVAQEVGARRFATLAPPDDLLKAYKDGWASWDKFAAAYEREVLAPLDPAVVVKRLRALVDGDPILLCYCKGDDGCCHRHLVAGWLRGVEGVEEWSPGPLNFQGSLF